MPRFCFLVGQAGGDTLVAGHQGLPHIQQIACIYPDASSLSAAPHPRVSYALSFIVYALDNSGYATRLRACIHIDEVHKKCLPDCKHIRWIA